MSDYISAALAAEKWGVSQRRVTFLCSKGRIPGAVKSAKSWALPSAAPKPEDRRYDDPADARLAAGAKAPQNPSKTGGAQIMLPERLAEQLAGIPDYPLTVVEASSGFGKTTAVREYLRDYAGDAYWHTALGESGARAWGHICELFARVSPEAVSYLKSLELPCPENLSDIASAVSEIGCRTPTALVIDNFHLIRFAEPVVSLGLADALSRHTGDNLNVIVIARQMGLREYMASRGCGALFVGPGHLFFDPGDIRILQAVRPAFVLGRRFVASPSHGRVDRRRR
jgi:hypothetical protein